MRFFIDISKINFTKTQHYLLSFKAKAILFYCLKPSIGELLDFTSMFLELKKGLATKFACLGC